MEIPSAGTKDHMGAHKQPVFPPEKRTFEVSNADFPMEMIASKADFSQEKQGKQASEIYPLVDSLPEKQDVPAQGDHVLPGKHDSKPLSTNDSTTLATNLLPEKHASANPFVLEKQTSELPGVHFLPGKHEITSLSVPGNKASEMHGIELLSEKQTPLLGVTEFSTENQASKLTPIQEKTDGGIVAAPNGHEEKTGGVIVAASNGCDPLPSELGRTDIDTAAPFESVKEAVTHFEDRIEWKPQLQILDHERKTAPRFDSQKANDEVVHYQELLRKEEAFIAEILLELEKTKEQIQVCKGKVPIISGNGAAFPPLNQPEEVLNVGVPKELYANVLHELVMARKEIEGVHEECALMESSKQSTLKEREAAFSAHDAASIRIKELMTERMSSQEALAAAKAALAETESEIDALRLTSSVELTGKSSNKFGGLLHVSNTKSANLRSSDLNLSETDTLIEKLKEELATIRDVKAKTSPSVSNSEGEIMRVELRLEQAKAAEGDRVAAIGRVLEELDVAKANLSKLTQDGAALTSAVGGLQAEVAKRRVELESAHETEQIACATLASLQDELCSIRDLVLSAHAGEVKAREAKRTYPTEIKQLAFEADEAKAASKLAKEEARKGTLELEQAKAATSTAVSRLQAAQKEAEAARASEAMAIAEFTALSESEGDLVDSKEGSEGGKVAVSISLEEYRALNDAGHGAEEAANEKVAATLVQVETAKASQKNAEAKLDAAMNELEVLQKAMEEAQKKADDAQTAKLSVEAELRKWRAEHEQRRRTGSNPSSVSTSAAQSPRLNAKLSSQGKVVPHSVQGKPAIGLDSLAEVLSLKLPPAEKAIRNLPEVLKKTEKAKKVSFFSRVMSIIVRKKSKSGKSVSNT